MLIVFLFLGIAIYMGLYFAWDFISGRLQGPTAWLASFQRMVFVPEHMIFRLFWIVLIVMGAYLVADFIISTAKRGLKKKAPPEEMKLKQITTADRTRR